MASEHLGGPYFRGTFQLSVTVLVRYRSRDVFSLGGWCPPTSRTRPKVRYSGPGREPTGLTPTGLSPSLAGHSRPLRLRPGGLWAARKSRPWPRPDNPTSPRGFPQGFGLGSSPFARRYSGNPILVSFPPPTWMLPFGGFPLPAGSARISPKAYPGRRSHSGIPGSTPARGYPGLIAACHALRRRPSRAIHQAGWRAGPTPGPTSGAARGLCVAVMVSVS